MGLGMVVEYAGKTRRAGVDRSRSGASGTTRSLPQPAPAAAPDETVTLTFHDIGAQKGSKFDTWTINNQSWPNVDPIRVTKGKRYRFLLRNGSGDQHPIHLHRHTFEVTQIGAKQLSGLRKDVINVMPLRDGCGRLHGRQSRRHAAALPPATAHGLRLHDDHQVQQLNARGLNETLGRFRFHWGVVRAAHGLSWLGPSSKGVSVRLCS